MTTSNPTLLSTLQIGFILIATHCFQPLYLQDTQCTMYMLHYQVLIFNTQLFTSSNLHLSRYKLVINYLSLLSQADFPQIM